MNIIGNNSQAETDKISGGFLDSFDTASKLISAISGLITIIKFMTGIESAAVIVKKLLASATTANTAATVGQTTAEAASTPVSYASASGFLAVGAGVLMMGLGIALAVSAIVMLLAVMGASVAAVASGIGNLIGSFKNPPKPNIQTCASGGFPSMGQMFIAREAGPELVGTIGSRTAVANNYQIEEGIARAVTRAMSQASLGGNWIIQLVDEGGIKSETIISAAERRNRRDGRTIIPLGV